MTAGGSPMSGRVSSPQGEGTVPGVRAEVFGAWSRGCRGSVARGAGGGSGYWPRTKNVRMEHRPKKIGEEKRNCVCYLKSA
jgi:hypothetical protein